MDELADQHVHLRAHPPHDPQDPDYHRHAHQHPESAWPAGHKTAGAETDVDDDHPHKHALADQHHPLDDLAAAAVDHAADPHDAALD